MAGYNYGGFSNPYGTMGESISSLGENVANAITEARKAKEGAAGAQLIADQALQSGAIDHDTYTKFMNASASQKNAMTGAFIHAQAFQSDQAQQLDRDRRTRLAFQQYNQQLAQQEYERNFQPGAPVGVDVPTGPPVSPFQQAQAGGSPGTPYDPSYSYQPTEKQYFVRPGPTSPYEKVTPSFNPAATATTIRDESGAPVARRYQTGPSSVEIEKLGEPQGPPRITPFTEPTTGQPVPNLYMVQGPGKEFKVVSAPQQGYSSTELSNIFKDFGVTPGQMLDSTQHHGFAGGQAAPWESATHIQVGAKGPTLPRDVFTQLQGLALQRAAVPQRGRTGPGVIVTPGGPPAPGANGSSGGVVNITSDDDYDALPSGTQFMGPDGKVRTKP